MGTIPIGGGISDKIIIIYMYFTLHLWQFHIIQYTILHYTFLVKHTTSKASIVRSKQTNQTMMAASILRQPAALTKFRQ